MHRRDDEAWYVLGVRYLLVMTANIYQLIQDIHAMLERTPVTLRAVFQKHDSELLDN